MYENKAKNTRINIYIYTRIKLVLVLYFWSVQSPLGSKCMYIYILKLMSKICSQWTMKVNRVAFTRMNGELTHCHRVWATR